MKYVKHVLILLIAAISLSACGVRGGLESPPEDVAANRAEKAAPGEPKAHKPFILDGLIR